MTYADLAELEARAAQAADPVETDRWLVGLSKPRSRGTRARGYSRMAFAEARVRAFSSRGSR